VHPHFHWPDRKEGLGEEFLAGICFGQALVQPRGATGHREGPSKPQATVSQAQKGNIYSEPFLSGGGA
jgi:hypothetical protein